MNKKRIFKLPYLSKAQRTGILVLIGCVVLLQLVLWLLHQIPDKKLILDTVKTQKWQNEIDSLKRIQLSSASDLHPFNPNYLQVDKARFLGLTKTEWERLKTFRAQNKFVNSAEEFQKVTKVSDTLLQKLAPFFKFPDWVVQKQQNGLTGFSSKKILPLKDINTATLNDLKAVTGVGDVLAGRILEERNKWNGFVSIDQLDFVWGLSGNALQEVKRAFAVKAYPVVNKVNINKCSKEELLHIPYINAVKAKQILIYRSKLDRPITIADLEKINGFPLDRLKIIALYLEF